MKALLFDFDGLIMDTEVPIYEAWRENYEAFGQDLPLEVYAGCVGSDFGGFDPKAHLHSLTDDPVDWEQWDQKRESRAISLVNDLQPMSGIESILQEAKEKGIPCAVASSSTRSWVETHLDRVNLREYFLLTRCVDDVSAPKPAPDLFLSAAEGLGVSPGEALVLEDSLNGLKAAMAAGSPCVAVPNRITAHLDFEGAAAVIEGLEEVSTDQLRQWHSGNETV